MEKIVVVMIVCERREQAVHALQSVLCQTVLPEAVVVVENSDGGFRLLDNVVFVSLVNWAAEMGVRVDVLVSCRLGMVKARIRGEEWAVSMYPGRLLMMADDDIVYDPQTLERYVESLKVFDVAGTQFFASRVAEKADSLAFAVASQYEERRYVGGTLAYRPELAGMWRKVLEVTPSILEDSVWQWMQMQQGKRWAPFSRCPPPALHLALFEDSKYGGTLADRFLQKVCGGEPKPIGDDDA